MASVAVDDVRDVINVSSAEVPDAKVLKMIKRAEVTLELETGREVDYSNCTDAEKEFITVLAAIYAICYLTGGSAVGLNFSVGDQNVSVLGKAPPLDVLQAELNREFISAASIVIVLPKVSHELLLKELEWENARTRQ